jgi:hypothetical protein
VTQAGKFTATHVAAEPDESVQKSRTSEYFPMMNRTFLLILALIATAQATAGELQPTVSSDDLDNPHRGYLLWGSTVAADGGVGDNFHGASMFHVYLPWREVETSDQQFDWAGFEQRHLQPILDEVPHATFVLRPVADYPDGVASNIDHFYTGGEPERDYPKFLEQAPLNIGFVDYTNCGGDGPGRSPDYQSPAMRVQMQQFVQALAARYDGDPRITAVQAGLLGFWGEWHTSGCEAMQPDATTRRGVRDAYAAAFTRTPLQTRYARADDTLGSNASFADGFEVIEPLRTPTRGAPSVRTRFGFYEDYFPSFTAHCNLFAPPLPLCDDGGDWNLDFGFDQLVAGARDNWQWHPLSGESPVTQQQTVWETRVADIEALIRRQHLSWLGPAGLHESSGHATALRRLKRALGYEFAVRLVRWPDAMTRGGTPAITLSLQNLGSAPLYHAYHAELQWLDGGGVVRGVATLDYPLSDLLPGDALQRDVAATVPSTLTPGNYSLRLALSDDVAGRRGVVPQNAGRDPQGRLILGNVSVAP